MTLPARRSRRIGKSSILRGLLAAGFFLLAVPADASDEKKGTMNILIRVGDDSISATLEDNPTAHDFLAMLPLNVVLEDYASTEKIAYLPRKLSASNAPAGHTPEPGDISYYAPWGNLALFYKGFRHSPGLIRIGRVTGNLDQLRHAGPGQAVIEKAN